MTDVHEYVYKEAMHLLMNDDPRNNKNWRIKKVFIGKEIHMTVILSGNCGTRYYHGSSLAELNDSCALVYWNDGFLKNYTTETNLMKLCDNYFNVNSNKM